MKPSQKLHANPQVLKKALALGIIVGTGLNGCYTTTMSGDAELASSSSALSSSSGLQSSASSSSSTHP